MTKKLKVLMDTKSLLEDVRFKRSLKVHKKTTPLWAVSFLINFQVPRWKIKTDLSCEPVSLKRKRRILIYIYNIYISNILPWRRARPETSWKNILLLFNDSLSFFPCPIYIYKRVLFHDGRVLSMRSPNGNGSRRGPFERL